MKFHKTALCGVFATGGSCVAFSQHHVVVLVIGGLLCSAATLELLAKLKGK